jgi:ABC-2 type transport system permease protein
MTDPGIGETAAAPVRPATSFWLATRLVAEREILTHVRGKAYWIMLAAFIVGIFAASVLPGRFGGDGAPTVATVGPVAERAAAEAGLDTRPQPDQAAAEEQLRAGGADAAVLPDPDAPTGLRVVALSGVPDEVVAALSASPPVDLLDATAVDEVSQLLVTMGFAMVFLLFGMGFGVGLAQSVVVEKQTRIVEILVATVPVRALLAGKIAGHSLLAFGQVAVLALAAPLALRAGDRGPLLATLGPALGWFVPFFVVGFVLFAAMFSVAGALVSRQEDLNTTTPLITGLIMIPYFLVIFSQDNQQAMAILSYLPFSAALAMPVRLFAADAQVWEPMLAMALLVATLVGTVLVATRLYAGSLLQTGARVRLRQAWSSTD